MCKSVQSCVAYHFKYINNYQNVYSISGIILCFIDDFADSQIIVIHFIQHRITALGEKRHASNAWLTNFNNVDQFAVIVRHLLQHGCVAGGITEDVTSSLSHLCAIYSPVSQVFRCLY
jgi:hypothetical protein